MTHELKRIIEAYEIASQNGIKSVLATVVALDGSSYRRPGVRMLLLENGKMVGAVSGGCVEKEVFRQAETVFKKGLAKVMTYDGRYRLGCEGILYILLEPLKLSPKAIKSFNTLMEDRETFTLKSHYRKEAVENEAFGSFLLAGETCISLREGLKPNPELPIFEHEMKPCFKLVIIGAEHDAVQFCSFAAMMGWEVTVVVHPKEEKTPADFPGAKALIANDGDSLNLAIDDETAIIVMTHSFSKDLKYLLSLKNEKPAYLGVLGPVKRREKLFDGLLERHPDIEPDFLEMVYGPAGIDIGAETPQEIVISVLSEILAVVNDKKVNSLKGKLGKIHA